MYVVFSSWATGYVPGPLHFTFHPTPLSFYNINHLYHYSYFACYREYTNCSIKQLSDCLEDIFHKMTYRKLKLNANKTELIGTGTPVLRCKRHDFPYLYFASTYSPNYLGEKCMSDR